ncbi:MAG: helix-turn-helix domain-containing protein [Bdellovibrionales bacterium]
MRIAKFVKAKRKERGINQKQLAEYAEVSFTFVNRIENGDINLQVRPLNKVLGVFGHEIGPVEKNKGHK